MYIKSNLTVQKCTKEYTEITDNIRKLKDKVAIRRKGEITDLW